jgi:hypothetical protein
VTAESGVTVALIAKDEELVLERCIRSFKDHVDQIIVADTGSTDRTVEIAKDLGAEVYVFDSPGAFFIDDEATCAMFGGPPPYSGRRVLRDFAAARNFSFSRAKQPYVMWIDADDVVEHPEGIRAVAKEMYEKRLEYAEIAYHTGGTQQIWRTRIIKRSAVGWVGSVHEDLVPCPNPCRFDNFHLVQHRPSRPVDMVTHHRNYKIMLRDHHYGARGERHLFYLAWGAMEAANEMRATDPALADEHESRAITLFECHLFSGTWHAQRAKAHRAIGDICFERGRRSNLTDDRWPHFLRALTHYAASAIEMPENPDGLLGCARAAYFLYRWHDCARFTEEAFKLGDPYSPPWSTSSERTFYPHLYYNKALWELRRVGEALDSCDAGLAIDPTNKMLLDNKAYYESRVARWGRG